MHQPLTERQQTAKALADELHKLGCWVVNPMPLSPDAQLRVQILDRDCVRVLEEVSGWGWSPAMCSAGIRFLPDGTAPIANIFEITIEADRQPIVPDRRIVGDIESNEVRQYRKLHGTGR